MNKCLILAVVLLVAGCANVKENYYQAGQQLANSDNEQETISEPKVLAGTTTKYIEFTKEAYDQALAENKVILLYFYASWCPLCRLEQPKTFAAFNELNNPNIIGFRVNYRDSDTDENEVELAKQFGISYQHTKVILKDGQRVLKAPDSWDKERYLEELNKFS